MRGKVKDKNPTSERFKILPHIYRAFYSVQHIFTQVTGALKSPTPSVNEF